MKTSTFEWTAEQDNDPEAMEVAWNRWIRNLRGVGFEPAEQPVRWTDTSATYELLALGGAQAFTEVVTAIAAPDALAVA